MKVVCKRSGLNEDNVTVGKLYDVLMVMKTPGISVWEPPPRDFPPNIYYRVVNDLGDLKLYSDSYFYTMEEWRDRQLNGLGI